MIHGYHVILPMYGVWLPNDPRGAWSDVVWKWELLQYGRPRRSLERQSLVELTPEELELRKQAQAALKYPFVQLNGDQALSVGTGFGNASRKNGYTIWACSILPQHAHLVVARHRYKVEQIATLLKGAATTRIIADNRHPQAGHRESDGPYPKMWAEKRWKVYLDSEQQIETAIRYVEENPELEEKPRQQWSFVERFRGLDRGHVTYH